MNTDTNTKTTQRSSTIEQLFKVGAHFGFTKRRRHPTVIPYLFGTKDGNDIFDLEQTAAQIEAAAAQIEDAAKQGKTIMYVGTKNEAKQLVGQAAERVGTPYVTNRWIGGSLTNFSEVKKRIKRLLDLEAEQQAGTLDRKYTKKERVMLGREMTKLRFNFGGMVTLERTPDLVVVIDPRHEMIAVEEATLLGLPIIGVMSSDVNADLISHPIVMNDSLQGSIAFVLEQLTAAHKRGVAAYTPAPVTSRPRTPRPRPSTPRA